MDLREKIAKLVGDAFVTCGSYAVEEPDALETADAILAIPEIKEALEVVAACQAGGVSFVGGEAGLVNISPGTTP